MKLLSRIIKNKLDVIIIIKKSTKIDFLKELDNIKFNLISNNHISKKSLNELNIIITDINELKNEEKFDNLLNDYLIFDATTNNFHSYKEHILLNNKYLHLNTKHKYLKHDMVKRYNGIYGGWMCLDFLKIWIDKITGAIKYTESYSKEFENQFGARRDDEIRGCDTKFAYIYTKENLIKIDKQNYNLKGELL